MAQGFAMLLSILQSLLVPKLLDVDQFGYWQLFIFYVSYVGFFPLGLNDGVYLINGGKTRDEINKRSIYSQMLFGLCFESVMALVIVAIALLGGFGPEREFVIVCTGLFVVIQDNAGYLSTLFQAMNETRRSSYALIVERASFLIPLVILLVTRSTDFRPYVIAYLMSSVVQLCYELHYYHDFVRSGFSGFEKAMRESLASMRVGIKLMLANIASLLILGVARFVIDAQWGISTFGELSLSLSMVNFFLAFINQASMVLFPALRQSKDAEVKSFYVGARDIIELVFPVVYLLYYPLVAVLTLWLPKYAGSFVFLSSLIPICVFDSKMNITCMTYFKVQREESTLLKVNTCTALASTIGVLLGAFLFNSITIVIASVVVAIIGRSMASEHAISRELSIPMGATAFEEIALTIVFIASANLLSPLEAMAIYALFYVAYLTRHRKRARELFGKLRNATN